MARKFRLHDPEVLRSGQKLRDQSWRAIFEGRLNYAPKFLYDKELPETATHDPFDGLIRTTMGYYRLAVDTRTEKNDGTEPVCVLLHSYERDQLETVFKDGRVQFKYLGEDHDVYGRTARRASGPRFLEDIIHDRSYLEKCFQRDMNLHTTEQSVPTNVVTFANGQSGYGIFETEDKKFRLRYYKNLRHEWDETSRFAKIDAQLPNGMVSKFFSLGRDVKNFDNYQDAFTFVRESWKFNAHSLFHGQSVETDSLKEKAASYVLKSLDRHAYRFWTSLALVSGVVIGLNNLLLGSSIRTAGWIVGVASAMRVGGNVLSSKLATQWMAKRVEEDRILQDSVKPLSDVDLVDSYLLKTPENLKRFLPRLDPNAFQYLRPLTHDEAKIRYSDSTLSDINDPSRVFESLNSVPYRYYGTVFDATHSRENGLLAAVFPNGLVSLTHVNRETHEVRRYITYRDTFNLVAKNAKHLQPHSLPSTGPIHKITHRNGDDFGYVGMNGAAFIADLNDKAGPGAQHSRVFGLSVTELFGVEDPGPVKAKEIPSVPVSELQRPVEQQFKPI